MTKTPKRPRDVSQLAQMMVDIASGEAVEPAQDGKQKDPAAVARGRAGGLKGGKARASKLLPSERNKIPELAANTRWGKS
jgi:hypothetical protein